MQVRLKRVIILLLLKHDTESVNDPDVSAACVSRCG